MKDNTLAVKWSKREDDLLINYPRESDGIMIDYYFYHLKYDNKNLIQELIDRGFDIKTLKFSVELKKEDKDLSVDEDRNYLLTF